MIAIPAHPTQIHFVRSISFANSVNVYSKVRHPIIFEYILHQVYCIFRLWLRRKPTQRKWFLPQKTSKDNPFGWPQNINILMKECKKCKCLEAGCECDPNAVNPDELCSRNEQCVNCQCLPFGKQWSFEHFETFFLTRMWLWCKRRKSRQLLSLWRGLQGKVKHVVSAKCFMSVVV